MPGSHDALIKFAVEALHSGRAHELAHAILRFSKEDPRELNDSQVQQINFSLLQWVLDNDRYFDAAAMLWPPSQFSPYPQSTKQVWGLWERSSQFLIQGAASTSKSFSVGVRLLLEWVRDPHYTTIKVLGPSEDHLKNNLFSHLVELHRGASILLPGNIGDLFIGMDPRARRGAISGVIIPIGKKSPAKLRGAKRFNRPRPHPKFGIQSRMFIFMDEVNNIPVGIWSDVDNILSQAEPDAAVFKVGGAYNPQDEGDQVGIRAEPVWGWASFDMEQHYEWKSKRGWDVLRLDALKCENVVQGKKVYDGLQTKEGIDAIIRNSGGTNTPGYFSMVRGVYPPKGQSFALIPQGLLHKAKASALWASAPRPCGGADLSLEGSDNAVFASGEWGLARGMVFPPSVEHPKGQELLFTRNGKPSFKMLLILKQLYPMPPADTVERAIQLKELCRKLGIRPEWFCVDRTGNGAGVHDHLKNYWSPLVRGVNYYESATTKKIFVEDAKTPYEEYQRMVSELWFATSKFLEFDYLKVDPAVTTEKLFPQLGRRLFEPGGKTRVESKKDYVARERESPNEADAATLLVHAVRMENTTDLSMNAAPGEAGGSSDDDGEDFFYVDASNLYANDL